MSKQDPKKQQSQGKVKQKDQTSPEKKQTKLVELKSKTINKKQSATGTTAKKGKVSKKEEEKKLQETAQKLALHIIETSELIDDVCESYQNELCNGGDDENAQEEQIKTILQLPLIDKYRKLLSHYRFDYMSMKEGR